MLFCRAKHNAMKDGGKKDDRGPGKYGQNCSNESCRHEQNRDQPPEQFHRADHAIVSQSF